MARELTDDEVFGGRELSDAEVFGTTKAAKPKPKRDWRDAVNDRARAFRQGATLGFGDELEGAKAAVNQVGANVLDTVRGRKPERSIGDAYRQTVDADRSAQRGYEAAHPVENVLLQTAGGLLTPGAGASANFVRGAGSFGAAVGRSALVGAGYGAVAGAGNADGNVLARAQGAGAGAAVGGVLGAAVPVVARASANVLARRGPVDEAAGMAQATEALQEAGVNVRAVSTATMDRIRMQVRQGRDAREAALGVVANTELDVPLPMSRGQRTGDPGQQLSENLMLRGAKGSAASRQMRGLVGEQQEALRGNVNAIGERITGGRVPERNAAGEAVSGRLNTMRDAANRSVNAAYDAAREAANDARLPQGESFSLASKLREAVRPHATERTAPGVFDEINALGAGRGIAMQDLQAARSRLVGLQQSSDGAVRNAAGQAKRALDTYISDAAERGIIQGDEAGLWRTAIAGRREFGRTYEAGDLVEKITRRTQDGTPAIDPNSAANEILSRSDMGFVGKKNLYSDIGRLRTMLGTDSPEWNGLRGEVFQRVASQGEGATEFAQRQFSGVKFQKAWQDFARKDPQLFRSLFTEAERAQIDRFATLAARVTSPVKGGDNSSNTAVAAMRLLGNLKFLRGLPFLKDISNEIEVQVNLGQARNATSATVGRAARPPRPTSGPVSSRAAAVAGQTGGREAVKIGTIRDGTIYYTDGTTEPE